ncbi:MAG: hypothetical protein GC182_08590 [Rhodopseudomonas sp.]|nr:hypothetical protein [Rhodopseudomonas sp.]
MIDKTEHAGTFFDFNSADELAVSVITAPHEMTTGTLAGGRPIRCQTIDRQAKAFGKRLRGSRRERRERRRGVAGRWFAAHDLRDLMSATPMLH